MRRILIIIVLVVVVSVIVGVLLSFNPINDSQEPTDQNSPAFPEPTFANGRWHFEVGNVTSGDRPISTYTVPTTIQSWPNITLRRVSLTFSFSFKEKELAWSKNFVINKTLSFLASLGIEAVEEVPIDGSIAVLVTAQAKWTNYVDERATYTGDYSGSGIPYPTAAEATYEMWLYTPDGGGRAGASGGLSYTQAPDRIYGDYSISSCPVDEAILPSLIDCFANLWGNQVYVSLMLDCDQGILIREKAADSLAVVLYSEKSDSLVSAFTKLLQDEVDSLQIKAAETLKFFVVDQNRDGIKTHVNDAIINDVVPKLILITNDDNLGVRAAAVSALGVIFEKPFLEQMQPGARQIIPVLIELWSGTGITQLSSTLDDTQDTVKLASACSGSLGWITGVNVYPDGNLDSWKKWWLEQNTG